MLIVFNIESNPKIAAVQNASKLLPQPTRTVFSAEKRKKDVFSDKSSSVIDLTASSGSQSSKKVAFSAPSFAAATKQKLSSNNSVKIISF